MAHLQRARLAKQVGVILLAAVLAVIAVCTAAFGAQVELAAPTTIQPSALAQSEASTLERFLGITHTQSQQSITTQRRAGDFLGSLKDRLRNDYAGAWFDPSTGHYKVGIVSATSSEAVASVASAHDIRDQTEVVSVKATWDQLMHAQDSLNAYLAPYFHDHVAATAIRPSSNAVVVLVSESLPPRVLSAIRDHLKEARVPVELLPSPASTFQSEPAACSFPNCDRPLRGGVEIESSRWTEGSFYYWEFCTAGFMATLFGTEAHYALTAGHCLAKNATTAHELWYFHNSHGEVETVGYPANGVSYYYGNYHGHYVDAAIIQSTEASNSFASWSGNTSAAISEMREGTEGETVCHEGRTSGTQCGVIHYVNESFTYGGTEPATLDGMVSVLGCALEGDSGGPVVMADGERFYAIGLLSGLTFTVEKPTSCTQVTQFIYQPLKAAVNAFGVYPAGTTLEKCVERLTTSGPYSLEAAEALWMNDDWRYMACGAIASQIYTVTGEERAFSEFGDESGTLGTGTLSWYSGSNAPPSAGQLGEAARAAEGAQQITIPVGQVGVVPVLSFPSGCSMTGAANLNMPNPTLDELFAGQIEAQGKDPHNGKLAYPANSWGSLMARLKVKVTDAGGTNGCEHPVTLMVSKGPSGSAFALKSYLAQIDTLKRQHTWEHYATASETWPSSTADSFGGIANSSDDSLARNVAADPGSIGYTVMRAGSAAGFSDEVTTSTSGGSASHQVVEPFLQNTGVKTKEAKYAAPQQSAIYSGGAVPADSNPPSPLASWTSTLASDPNIAEDTGHEDWPLVALTYALAWTNYEATKLAPRYSYVVGQHRIYASQVANNVRSALSYVASPLEGQCELEEGDGAASRSTDCGLLAPGSTGVVALPEVVDRRAEEAVTDIH